MRPTTANKLKRAECQHIRPAIGEVGKDAEDNHFAIFSARVAADLQGEELLAIIAAVLKTADDMEQRLGGRDDF